MKTWAVRLIGVLAGLLVVFWGAFVWQWPRAAVLVRGAVPKFRHVVVIMMENHGWRVMNNPNAAFLQHLRATAEIGTQYYGVTHPSLPNYVALLTGRTFASHSDSPTQFFRTQSLVNQLDAHGISWQGVMESIPRAGYLGNWYPLGRVSRPPILAPTRALYAKKHDPFLLVSAGVQHRQQVVPLSVLHTELSKGHLPQFVWISPNLCNDMHGQPNRPGAVCPANRPNLLVRQGNAFLAHWIAAIEASPAWQHGNNVIFVTWDEAGYPGGAPTPATIRHFLSPGPDAPGIIPPMPFLGRLGGGRVPLLVLTSRPSRPAAIGLWSDHYSILKTIEASWHLGFLGHAQNPQVPILAPFFP